MLFIRKKWTGWKKKKQISPFSPSWTFNVLLEVWERETAYVRKQQLSNKVVNAIATAWMSALCTTSSKTFSLTGLVRDAERWSLEVLSCGLDLVLESWSSHQQLSTSRLRWCAVVSAATRRRLWLLVVVTSLCWVQYSLAPVSLSIHLGNAAPTIRRDESRM